MRISQSFFLLQFFIPLTFTLHVGQAYEARRFGNHSGPSWDIGHDHGIRADHRTIANLDSRKDHCPGGHFYSMSQSWPLMEVFPPP